MLKTKKFVSCCLSVEVDRVVLSVSAEDKVSELSDEDVTVAYMGDELDLKTVGDIIAIIEDKVQKGESTTYFHSTNMS